MTLKDLIGKKDIVINLYNNNNHRTRLLYVMEIKSYPGNSNYVTVIYAPTSKNYNYKERISVMSSELVAISADETALAYGRQWMKNNLYQTLHTYYSYIGSDPEMFVTNANGDLIPAFDFLGSKTSPYKHITPSSYGGNGDLMNNVYWDGYQAEFDTKPDTCMGWHADSIQAGMAGILAAAKLKYPEAKLSLRTVFNIPPSRLDNDAEEHVSFGCMPSLNAYGMEGLKAPGRTVGFRSTGGHIHLGNGVKKVEQAIPIVKALDMVLGVACVSMFAKYDDPRRRTMYGLAGEYRMPPHGIEYRVLSNAWMCHPLAANIVFDLARSVAANADYILANWNCTEEDTIATINFCDVDKARNILKKNHDLFNALLKVRYADTLKANVAEKIFLNGIESAVIDPENVSLNWRIEGDIKWIGHSSKLDMANLAASIREGKKVA